MYTDNAPLAYMGHCFYVYPHRYDVSVNGLSFPKKKRNGQITMDLLYISFT